MTSAMPTSQPATLTRRLGRDGSWNGTTAETAAVSVIRALPVPVFSAIRHDHRLASGGVMFPQTGVNPGAVSATVASRSSERLTRIV